MNFSKGVNVDEYLFLFSMNIAGSVESYVQSSPESDHCDYSMTSTR